MSNYNKGDILLIEFSNNNLLETVLIEQVTENAYLIRYKESYGYSKKRTSKWIKKSEFPKHFPLVDIINSSSQKGDILFNQVVEILNKEEVSFMVGYERHYNSRNGMHLIIKNRFIQINIPKEEENHMYWKKIEPINHMNLEMSSSETEDSHIQKYKFFISEKILYPDLYLEYDPSVLKEGDVIHIESRSKLKILNNNIETREIAIEEIVLKPDPYVSGYGNIYTLPYSKLEESGFKIYL